MKEPKPANWKTDQNHSGFLNGIFKFYMTETPHVPQEKKAKSMSIGFQYLPKGVYGTCWPRLLTVSLVIGFRAYTVRIRLEKR